MSRAFQNIDSAKRTLKGYFYSVFQGLGTSWTSENDQDIEMAVDMLVEGITELIRDEFSPKDPQLMMGAEVERGGALSAGSQYWKDNPLEANAVMVEPDFEKAMAQANQEPKNPAEDVSHITN